MSSSSSYVDTTTSAIEHCETMSSLHPDLSSQYNSISDLFSRKLWHQLTMTILEFVSTPTTTLRLTPSGGNSYLSLYDRVVLACDKKLNQLTLARISSIVAESLLSDGGDYVAARAVLENLLDKKSRLGAAPALYAESRLALLHLARMEQQRTSPDTKTDNDDDDQKLLASILSTLSTGEKILSEMDGAADANATVVHSAFYESSMTYHKIMGTPEAFYREALLYLNYTPLSNLSAARKYQLATDVCLAAVTGEGVFNFGDIATHAILECLKETEMRWLFDLMTVFANGDVVKFREITKPGGVNETAIAQQGILIQRAELVKEKMTLLALVNMVFERPSAERTLSFGDVAARTGVEPDKVEWVIMRALSLGLIKGSMDQIDETVTVSWVMPRVLDKMQLTALAGRFADWAVKVSKTKDYMGEQNPVFT